jgi:hypothetical protein
MRATRMPSLNPCTTMKRTPHSICLVLAGLALAEPVIDSAHAINLLTNPGFEQPQVTTPGNNFPATLPGWTLQTTTAPCENGHNVVRAGPAYDGGPDNAVEGTQYYDICGAAGYLSQNFTLNYASDVSFGASFSRRETAPGGSNVAIYDATNTTRLAESPSAYVYFLESQEFWVQSSAVTTLAAGTYVVRVNLQDAANADAVFVTPVQSMSVGTGPPASVTETALDLLLSLDVSPITFNGGSAPLTVPITATKNITRNVTIDGDNIVTLNAGALRRHFIVAPGVTLELRNITLDNGFAGPFGASAGAILNRGTVVLNNVHITRSVTGGHGGAIQNSGTVNATGCRFDYNRADINGGAIDNTGRLVLYHSTAAKNSAGFRGGSIYNYLGFCDVTNCQLKWNTAGAYGGGMAADGGFVALGSGRIRGNRAGGSGGGLSLNADSSVGFMELSLNTAAGPGGGVLVAGGSANLHELRIYNCAGSLGGGLAVQAGTTRMDRTILQYNRNTSAAPQINHGGGGVYVEGGSLTISESRISRNHSTYAGGGVMVNDRQAVTLKNCLISENTASFGQVGSQQGSLFLEDCTVANGTTGIWADGGTVDLRQSTLFGNSGFNGGGMALRRGAAATITNSTISSNVASWGGGLHLESGFGGASANLTNVTVFGNQASIGGNLYLGAGTDVTISLTNSIVANPNVGGNCAGKEITTSRYSISSDNLCALAGPGDRNGVNPLLGPLQDNGGATWTHMPLPGSPAIDGVLGVQAPALDQLSRNRPAGLGFDIGAFEVNATGGVYLNPPPPATFDGNDTVDDDGDGSPDAQELIAGTDPNSPADVFRLSTSPANPLQVNFSTRTGMFYRLYVTPDHAPTPLSQWVNAGQQTITGNDGVRSFIIVQSPGITRRFYRVMAMRTDGPWP